MCLDVTPKIIPDENDDDESDEDEDDNENQHILMDALADDLDGNVVALHTPVNMHDTFYLCLVIEVCEADDDA